MYKINKKIIIVIILVAVLMIGYFIYSSAKNEDNFIIKDDFEEVTENSTKEVKQEEKTIIVHIDGCVVNPGIVKIEEGARIFEAVEKAGGLTSEADTSKINLALIVEDGIKIHIPSYTENKGDENMENNIENNNTNEKININTASQQELDTLPGIGDSTAQKIINYRKENGKFNNIEDIKNVKGIGQSKYDEIKDLITLK